MSTRPPGPKGLPVVGNSYHYARDPFAFMTACARAYDGVVELDLGGRRTYMLLDPADVERVLVSDADSYVKTTFRDDAIERLLGEGLLLSEGERWRRQRQLLQPAFAPERVAGLAGTMADHAANLVERWSPGETVDVEREMQRVTVRIIVDAMFGTTLDEATTERLRRVLEPVGRRFEPDVRRVLVPDWLPTEGNRSYEAAVSTLDDVVADLVAERRHHSTAGGDDVLSILLRAQADGEHNLSEDLLRDELVTMLLAGHDTTALALTYAFFLLSEHPDAEDRLAREVDAAVEGGRPTLDDVRELPFAERVLQESLRLYPPVYAMFREPTVDVTLGGYRVPAGSALLLSQWATHRDPAYWDDPESFDPDRFAPDRAAGRPRFSYFPFGGGPRHCIGKAFSMLEARIILATVASRYRLAYVGETPLSLRGSITMHPENEMEMRVEAR